MHTKRNENKEEIDPILLAASSCTKMLQGKKEDYSLKLRENVHLKLIKSEGLNI
jgi:hypothetical protein